MPAFEKGMAEQRAEVDAIAKSTEAPTFENTIVAMEKTGRLLTRVQKVFFNLEPEQRRRGDAEDRGGDHAEALCAQRRDPARCGAVSARRGRLRAEGEARLDAESAQLLERYHRMFVRAGAKLDDAHKTRLKELNEQISGLNTSFRQKVLQATKDGAVVVEDVKQLDGFTPEQISAAGEAAKARGMAGKWLITLRTRPSSRRSSS